MAGRWRAPRGAAMTSRVIERRPGTRHRPPAAARRARPDRPRGDPDVDHRCRDRFQSRRAPPPPPAPRRRLLRLDAATCAATGALLALAAPALEPPLGLPAALLREVGVALVPFAALLLWIARAPRPARGAVWAVVAANALWVAASVALLPSGLVAPTPLGGAFVLAQAAVVAALAWLEYAAVRRA
jgi:hypothetical protein